MSLAIGIDIAGITKNVANTAFGVIGTARQKAILHFSGPGIYDPVTDTTTPTVEEKEVEGALYKARQTQGTIESINRGLFTFEAAEAPDGIDEQSTVEIDGTIWEIEEVQTVPGKSVITLNIKK